MNIKGTDTYLCTHVFDKLASKHDCFISVSPFKYFAHEMVLIGIGEM